MIFKVNFNTKLVNSSKNTIYVSFCANKLEVDKATFHKFLFKFLYDRKIINIAPYLFSCEIQRQYVDGGTLIKCFMKKQKQKLLCQLAELAKPQDKSFIERLIIRYPPIHQAKKNVAAPEAQYTQLYGQLQIDPTITRDALNQAINETHVQHQVVSEAVAQREGGRGIDCEGIRSFWADDPRNYAQRNDAIGRYQNIRIEPGDGNE